MFPSLPILSMFMDTVATKYRVAAVTDVDGDMSRLAYAESPTLMCCYQPKGGDSKIGQMLDQTESSGVAYFDPDEDVLTDDRLLIDGTYWRVSQVTIRQSYLRANLIVVTPQVIGT